jgi:hypothetical protein
MVSYCRTACVAMQVPCYYPIDPNLSPLHTCHAPHFLPEDMSADDMCASDKVYLVQGIEGMAIYHLQWVIF